MANPRAADAPWLSVPGASGALRPLRETFEANDNAAFAQEANALRAESTGLSRNFSRLLEDTTQDSLSEGASFPLGLDVLCGGRDRSSVSRLGPAGYAAAWVLPGLASCCRYRDSPRESRSRIAHRSPTCTSPSFGWHSARFFRASFEAIYRSRYFLLGAVPVAVVSLILADTQTLALDRSINPLVPVLRDNFWLTTHVLTITLSYAAFALALGIGHIALGKVIRGAKPEASLYNYLYRTLQVGVLLLATGTILGGVWANYSWGRFWDWDPKETWALITLLGYLIVLHGRIAGRWAGFGMAVGSVLAFQGVLMAWYGVNFVLGVGLHSYGFGTGGFGWALLFVAAEISFVSLAVVRKAQSARRSTSPAVSKPQLLSRAS